MKSHIKIFLFTILDMWRSKNMEKFIVQILWSLFSDAWMDTLVFNGYFSVGGCLASCVIFRPFLTLDPYNLSDFSYSSDESDQE